MRFFALVSCLFLLYSCGPKIIDKPIVFNDLRRELSLKYMEEHYGIEKNTPVIEPKMVVVHWTAIPTLEGSFNAFRDPLLPNSRTAIKDAGSLNVSVQFLVDRDGSIYRLMPETTMGRHVIGLNHVAIGIENVGGTKTTPLTRQQLKANIELIKYLSSKYDIEYVLGHYQYQNFEQHELWKEKDEDYRTHKIDPGEDFMAAIWAATKDLNLKPVPKEKEI